MLRPKSEETGKKKKKKKVKIKIEYPSLAGKCLPVKTKTDG